MKTKAKTWTASNRKHLYLHQSGTYYARLAVNGKQTWRSLRTKLKSIAESKLAGLIDGEARKVELGCCGTDWKTMGQLLDVRAERIANDPAVKPSTLEYRKTIHVALKRSWQGFRELAIDKVTRQECERWAVRFARDYSATRYNNALAALKDMFSIAVEHGIRHTNPTNGIKRLKPSQKDLTEKLPDPSQFRQWVEEIRKFPSRWREGCGDLVEFLAYTGLRIGEARLVKWKHIDEARNQVVVVGDPATGTKNREIRRVPIVGDLQRLLTCIKRRTGMVPEEKVVKVSSALTAMKTAAEKVGIEPLTHHDLRHFFATTCIESGVDIPTVSRWLGHKDGGALAMRVYGHLRNQHSLDEAKKVLFG